MRIGLLSSYGNPQLPHFIKALVEEAVTDLVVILDSQQMNAKDLNIWERRTGVNSSCLESATSRPPAAMDLSVLCRSKSQPLNDA